MDFEQESITCDTVVRSQRHNRMSAAKCFIGTRYILKAKKSIIKGKGKHIPSHTRQAYSMALQHILSIQRPRVHSYHGALSSRPNWPLEVKQAQKVKRAPPMKTTAFALPPPPPPAQHHGARPLYLTHLNSVKYLLLLRPTFCD